MSAVETNREVLAALGRNDRVDPVEQLKARTLAVFEKLDAYQANPAGNLSRAPLLEACLEELSPLLDEWLATALSLVEYGGREEHRVVGAMLNEIAAVSRRPADATGISQLALTVVWRVLLALTAFALNCERTEALTSLRQVQSTSRYTNEPVAVMLDSEARYLEAYGGDAGVAFDAHLAWLIGREWVSECYPLLAREGRIESALKEADLILAVVMTAVTGHQVFSAGTGSGVESSIRQRVTAPEQRHALASLAECDPADLESVMQAAYQALRRPQGMMIGIPMQLFPDAANE